MPFNAKNLQYEKQEPAFLRRLRGEQSNERHSVNLQRPNKPRLETRSEDDGPTIVGDDGQVMTEEDYEAMVNGRVSDDQTASIQAKEGSAALATSDVREELTNIGGRDDSAQPIKEPSIGQKRKKHGKIIGGDDGTVPERETKVEEVGDKKKNAKTKKGKKVKLSFDIDEG
ncbi:MAG: hypothetical protein Q9227_009450 [Pyrenula ochraceoflavens]